MNTTDEKHGYKGHGKGHGYGHGQGQGHGASCGCGPGGMGPDMAHKFMKGFGGHMGPINLQNIFAQLQNFVPYDLDETEDGNEYIVTMALPGYDVKEIEVSVKGNNILIEANKDATNKEEEKTKKIVTMGSIFWDRPHLSVKIPVNEEIDTENVQAKLSKGILKIRFKKIPGTKINVEEQD